MPAEQASIRTNLRGFPWARRGVHTLNALGRLKGRVPVLKQRRLPAGVLDGFGSQPGRRDRDRGVGGAVPEHGPNHVELAPARESMA